MNFSVTVLGTASAIPNSKRNPSSQLINIHERYFLVDCGEGTQIQIRKNKQKLGKINHIFISHLHGDHIYGLFPLLSTYNLLDRTSPLHIYANKNLEKILAFHVQYFISNQKFEIIFHTLPEGESINLYEDDHVLITAFPLQHSVPTHGFLFKEKDRLRKINKHKIKEYNIPVTQIMNIKNGASYTTKEGKLIPNNKITLDPPPARRFAYCSDTAYTESILPFVENVDLLYHEATFKENEKERAKTTQHSTAKEAATIAKLAKAKRLLVGHFSSRYKYLEALKKEAQIVFKETELAIDGETYIIPEKIIYPL